MGRFLACRVPGHVFTAGPSSVAVSIIEVVSANQWARLSVCEDDSPAYGGELASWRRHGTNTLRVKPKGSPVL